MYDFSGKMAVVTGAALGIGRSIADRIAAEGCDLALFDKDSGALEETASSLRGAGNRVSVHTVDVSDNASVVSAIKQVEEQAGKIDFLVNNAGISTRNSFLEADAKHFGLVMDVNVWGVFNCSKAVMPTMLRQGGGRIINIASWAGKMALPQYFAYCTSKFAVIGMTQAMAVDLGPSGILVNSVCPGIIDNTPTRLLAETEAKERGLPSSSEREKTVPLRRLGQPGDVSSCVAFLLSDEALYLTGQSLNATGGLWMN